MSTYTIHRSEKNRENPYAQISRKMAQDSSLSFQARGLMLYILSKPPAWKGKAADLQREGKIKAKALKTILDELIEKQYVVRHEDRSRKGRFEYKLEVFEEPELNTYTVEPEECLTAPPSRGVGADAPSRLDREVGPDIDSTRAGAFSSVENKERERALPLEKPRQKGYRDPRTKVEIPTDFTVTPALRKWALDSMPGVNVDNATERWKRHCKKTEKKLFPEHWGEDWEQWILGEKVTNGNGYGNNGAKPEPVRQRTQYEILKEQGKI